MTGRALPQGRGCELKISRNRRRNGSPRGRRRMGLKTIVVVNTGAHHRHREMPQTESCEKLNDGPIPPPTTCQRRQRVSHSRPALGVRMIPDCTIKVKVEPARSGLSVTALFEDPWKGCMSWRRL
jgi:hypothetical protein